MGPGASMKVVSWNVFNLNHDSEAFASFIKCEQADVYALQELTDEHIAFVRTLEGYQLFSAEDFIEGGQVTYLGILTRLPSRDHEVIAHNPDRTVSDSFQGRRMKWRECLDSHAVTVTADGHDVRIVNLHLSCGVPPRIRREQLNDASRHWLDFPRAVASGDIHSFGRPLLNLAIGWFYGFGLSDALVNEDRELTRFAQDHGFKRAFQHAITFPRFRLHLDHLLVRGMSINGARVERDTHGSDHRPLIVELAP